MNYWLYFVIPVLSALIGWVTIWVAIKMLFRPVNPVKFAGLRIQGVFPRHRQRIAENLAKTVSRELVSFSKFQDQISDASNLEKIKPLIETHIDDFLRNRLAVDIPMIGMFVGDKTIEILKTAFMKELGLLFPIIMKEYASTLQNELDFEKIVVQKLAQQSPLMLEKIVARSMTSEFKMALVLGVLIGFLIGVIQVIIIQLIS